jgi:predicted nucleotidyltransferase
MFDTSLLDETLKRQREKRDRERVALLNRVTETLKVIRGKYGIQTAYIVGSLLVEYRWHRLSDIDIAISGCSMPVLDIMKELEDATGKTVDVVDLDQHAFPHAFRRKGLKIYG